MPAPRIALAFMFAAGSLFGAGTAARAEAIRFEFTAGALKIISDNELRRTQLCVVNDVRLSRLEAKRKALQADQETAQGMGRADLAKALDIDLAKVETDLAEVERNFFRCDGAFLLGPLAQNLCAKIGAGQGTLCPALANAKAEGQALSQVVGTLENLVTGQAEQGWRMADNPGALGPDGRLAGAVVRRGNLQVAFRIGAEDFPIGKAPDAIPRDLEKRLREVNRTNRIALEGDGVLYVPFLSAEVSGASGFAGETFQTLVGIRGAEGYVPLGPAVPVSIEAKATSHGVPLDGSAWATLPAFEVIGIVASKRVGDKDEFLYFIGIETLGLQPLLDQLMTEYRGR